MKLFRTALAALAVIYAGFVGLTALAGVFADGGDTWSRPLIVLLHPLSAAAVLLLVLPPRPGAAFALGVAALLAASAAANVVFAVLIAQSSVKGDWELPLVFAVIPAAGIAYALMSSRPR